METKPKIGFLPAAKKSEDTSDVKLFVEYVKKSYGNDKEIELTIPDEILFDEDKIIEAAWDMEKDRADLIVFVVGSWIYSSHIISAANELDSPFILFGLSDKMGNGNLGASLQIKYVLEEMGIDFKYLCGKIDDKESHARIKKYLTAAWARNNLRNRKIGIIGGKCMMMYQTQVNEFDWKKVFGVDFPQYDTAQLFTEMKNIDQKEAGKIADDFIKKFDKVNWELDNGDKFDYDAVVFQAKMFLAFKRMKELYGIDIFANKCMPEMTNKTFGYSCAACLATCMLNEEGITTACEADVPAGLSMYILSLISKDKAFFADIAKLDKQKKLISFFNCGTAPISMADKKRGISMWPIPSPIADVAVPYEYYTSKMEGACLSFELENDRTVTMLRVGGNSDSLRFHVCRATTADRDVREGEVYGIKWPGFGIVIKNGTQKFLENATGHHYSIVYGDWVEELQYLSKILGIKFVFDE